MVKGDRMGARRVARFPDLEKLHKRHVGLTESVCLSFAEAARVCLSRHHVPPAKVTIRNGLREAQRTLSWRAVGKRECKAWNNVDDATRDGAYSLSLAAVEAE